MCIARLGGAALGKKIRQPAKIISEAYPKNKISHCNPSRCNAIQRYPIYASFPPTVLAVSGSRVKAISLISAGFAGSPKTLNKEVPFRKGSSSLVGCSLAVKQKSQRLLRIVASWLFVLRCLHYKCLNQICQAIWRDNSLPPRMWKCRWNTVWPASAPQLLTTR